MSETMDFLHNLIGSQDGDINAWQMSIRGILIFAAGVLAVRVAASRAFGKWTPLDIIFAVIVGSNLGRAMTGSAPFVATLVATMVLVAIHALLARASSRWTWLSFLVKGSRICLVRNGKTEEGAMRRSGIGDGDLAMALRVNGHKDLSRVREAYLERNGDITFITDSDEPAPDSSPT